MAPAGTRFFKSDRLKIEVIKKQTSSKMKKIEIRIKNTPKGWELNIPRIVSTEGKRQRLYFKSRDAAERRAGPLREAVRNGEAANSILPAHLARIAESAFSYLGDLPADELILAAKAWAASKNILRTSKTFADVVSEFCSARSHNTEKYLSDFYRYPKRFPQIAAKLLAEITHHDIEKILAPLPAVAKNSTIDRLSALFNFGIKKGWAVKNPFEKIDKAHHAPPQIHVIDAAAVGHLFSATINQRPELVPMIAIMAFAGVRPTEATKITWEDFDFADGVLTIPAKAAKTRRARHITLHPVCLEWVNWSLKQNSEASGPICEHPPMTLRRYLRAIRDEAGLNPWPQDALRHTFASAALAADWRDIGGLCLDLGHTSQAMLHKHYHRAMRRAPAEAVFAVKPPEHEAGKIIRMAG